MGADAESRGAELEEAMNDQSSDAKYKDKFKLLKINLGRNEELRNKFCDGAVTAQELCSMDPKQMLTKQQVEKKAAMKDQAWDDAQVPVIPMDETDQFQCGKCKKRRTVYFQKQTRSAYEPMTTFVSCKECGNQWRC